MKKKLIAGIFAMFFVGILFSTSALAYRGNYEEKSPYFDEDRCALMQDASYEQWYELMSLRDRVPRVLSVVNEENFDSFIKARLAAKDGNFEEANDLREEIGLFNGQGQKNEYKHEVKLQLNNRMQNRLHR